MRVIVGMENRLDIVSRKIGVQLSEPLNDKPSVFLILRKDDRLTESLTAINFDALFHKGFKHVINGLLIENPAVNLIRRDLIGDLLARIFKILF